MRKIVFVLMLATTSAMAQTDAKGEWQFPSNVRLICVDTEQKLVSSFKEMIVQNRLGAAADNVDTKRKYFELANAWKQSMEGEQRTWEQLGCASILYPKK